MAAAPAVQGVSAIRGVILAQPFTAEQPDSQFSLAAHVVGWAYHFSNGITFGVMYMAMIGEASRRSWLWAILLATGLELAMLITPYAGFFGITVTCRSWPSRFPPI